DRRARFKAESPIPYRAARRGRSRSRRGSPCCLGSFGALAERGSVPLHPRHRREGEGEEGRRGRGADAVLLLPLVLGLDLERLQLALLELAVDRGHLAA